MPRWSRTRTWDAVKSEAVRNKKKTGEKLAVVKGGQGRRIIPATNAGIRIDMGPVITNDPTKIKVYLQIDKNPKESALKELLKRSKRGTHSNFAEAIIDTTKPPEERVDDMLDQLEAADSDDSEEEEAGSADSEEGE
jgi:hypothetical protein